MPSPTGFRRALTRLSVLTALGLAIAAAPAATNPAVAQDSALVVADSFSRSSSGGWRSADRGGQYQVSPRTSAFRTSGGTGLISLGSRGALYSTILNRPQVQDVDLVFRAKLGVRPLRSNVAVIAVLRNDRAGNEYRAVVGMRADGAARLSIQKVVRGRTSILGRAVIVQNVASDGGWFWVRAKVESGANAQISAKAWRVGEDQPGVWALTRADNTRVLRDSGRVGIRAVVKGKGRLPILLKVDDLRAKGTGILRQPGIQLSGPKIQSVRAQDITRTTAQVRWSLDEPATGQVEYGRTDSYGKRTTAEKSLTYSTHVQTIQGLQAGRTYHYRVRSTNRAGVETVSIDRTFTTSGGSTDEAPAPTSTPAATPRPTTAPAATPRPTTAPTNAPAATPRPTATPTPRPTATPTPRPTATPTPRPTATPTPASGTVNVPSSIDSSGGSDVSSALQSFVNGVPNGSTIVFRSGGTYRVERGIRITNRRNLVFDGNGATIRTTGAANTVNSSLFVLADGNQGITIKDFTLVGNNPNAGTAAAYSSAGENQMGVAVYGSTDINIQGMTIRDLYGDCLYIGSTGTTVWSDTVRFHDSSCTLTGRHGVTIIAGRNITVEGVTFDRLGMFVVDMEPDYASQGATDVMIRSNKIGSYGLNNRYTSWLLAAEGATGSLISRITVSGNDITGSAASGYEGKALGLHVTIKSRGTREDFVIKNNVSTRRVAGPSLEISGVNRLTITGNTQPLSSGSLARLTSCTNVVMD